MLKYSKTIIALSIIPQVILVKWLANYPEIVETYYSNGFYLFISKALRYAFGWVPFSVGDLIYTMAFLYAFRWLITNRKRIIKETLLWFRDILIAISFIYFAFHLFWGLNYYRLPLHESLELSDQYSTEQLETVIEKLTIKANNLHSSISENDTIKVTMPFSKKELLKNSSLGYEKLRETYPKLNPLPKSVKRSIYSLPSAYLGVGGYLNPFTNEGQINSLGPLHRFPNTICHEQAHQVGYAAENESNFIGCLASMNHEDPYYQYSGTIFALKHCLLEMQLRNDETFKSMIENVNRGIIKNYQEEYDFIVSYQNAIQPVFDETFDQFLKANNQDKGIESYSYVVALLVNHFINKQ